jgi:hypothetical protein
MENGAVTELEGPSFMPALREPFMPALSIEQAVDRFNSLVEFVRTVMRDGTDYGRIPGTDKPTLLKPGAEKLCTLFGLSSRFTLIRAIEDWTGEDHAGEPFFYYLYRCQLWRGDLLIAEGDGSCNSFEQRYRYREAQRRCPACGLSTIIKGKEEFGGGWICFRKKGGCGAKYRADDATIVNQPAGRVPNEQIADQVNTIQKMAQKRALVASTLIAVNGSEFFTQDTEDLSIVFASSSASVSGAPAAALAAPSAPADEVAAPTREDLLETVANLCRALKTAGHPDFKDRESIVAHLKTTAERHSWKMAPARLKGFSDLPLELLSDYATLLEVELSELSGRNEEDRLF